MIWSRPELRVLFVCTANICRSPLAEGLLRHRLHALGLADRVQVRSAGTQAVQRGCRPDPRMEEVAAEAGVSLAGIRARMLTPKLIQNSDYVLVMERRHLAEVQQLHVDAPGESSGSTSKTSADGKYAGKIQLLGSFLPAPTGRVVNADREEIPDPYFGDLQGIYNVYQLIDSALTEFMYCINSHVEESGRY